MQTFITHFPEGGSFEKTTKILDGLRLRKQALEASQIINVLTGNSVAWKNHPAVLMWSGFVDGLKVYHRAIVDECQSRKYDIDHIFGELFTYTLPSWCFDKQIIDTHRARLNFKGRADAVCATLKKYYKVRSINKWLDDHGFPEKPLLRRMDVIVLEGLATRHGCKLETNYYTQYGWVGERDSEEGYIWPTKIDKPITDIKFNPK